MSRTPNLNENAGTQMTHQGTYNKRINLGRRRRGEDRQMKVILTRDGSKRKYKNEIINICVGVYVNDLNRNSRGSGPDSLQKSDEPSPRKQ